MSVHVLGIARARALGSQNDTIVIVSRKITVERIPHESFFGRWEDRQILKMGWRSTRNCLRHCEPGNRATTAMNLYESMGRISVGGVKREQISSKGRW